MALRTSCPCGHSGLRGRVGVWQTDIYFYAWKYKKKPTEKCLWIVSQFALQNEMQITTALSALPLGSQNLFWFEAFFYLYNYHKITLPKAQKFFSSEIFRVSFFACPDYSFSLLFPVLFFIFLIYLLNHAIQSTYNAKTMSPSVCCAPAAQKTNNL